MIDDQELEDFLEHFGVKGMHWGVRHTPGVSNKVNRMAAKDAQEHARAKMFYGEGAGNRRKLINAKVDYNKRNVSGYAKAFDNHLNAQNLSEHSTKATKERQRIDRRTRNKQRTGAVARHLTGQMGTQAAFVALAAGGVAFARSSKGRQLLKKGVSKIKDTHSEFLRRQGAKHVQNMLKNLK